ncbi:MAG: hypothetical protein ABWX67_10490 [Allosphingosinicella sp.]
MLNFPILLALALTPTAAQPAPKAPFVWQDGDRPLPPHPSRAARDGFAAMMLVTPDADAFIAEWQKPETPNVATTERIARDKPVFAMLLVAGCRPAADGNCRVAAEFRMKRPDGAPYGEARRGLALDGPPAPGGNLQLAMATLGFSLDPPDPPGRYTIVATLTDEIAGVTLTVEQSVEADKAPRKR